MTIERAASAIAATYGPLGQRESWGSFQDQFRVAARAALATIEEPTEAMLEAGYAKMAELREDADFMDEGQLMEIWRAMHKAMMEENGASA